MNKKGFTLVELLAVIAILAILVIIALPNVLKLYNDARKNAFLTETKTIYNEVSKKYITSNISGNKLSYINSEDDTKLNLSGEDIDYCIHLNTNGTVKTMSVKNNNYYIEYNDSEDITKYTKDNVKESTNNTKIICNNSYTKVIESPEHKKCTSGKTLTNGIQYNDETYTYTYKDNSWSVKLTNTESTSPITNPPCSIIDDKKVTSMENMFTGSKATYIDLTNFNTENITNMSYLFKDTSATEIRGLEYINTSNVSNMIGMFYNTNVSILDLRSLDTSKVKYMDYMFALVNAESLDFSSFDTSNVLSMESMFVNSKTKELDLRSFNTSKVTSMKHMFLETQATKINISSFDTSNVTNMFTMFGESQITSIDLTNFNTSKVTNMQKMFLKSKIKTLDLSSFDLTNADVTNIFINSSIEKVYAKTESDANKLKNTSYLPSGISIQVK